MERGGADPADGKKHDRPCGAAQVSEADEVTVDRGPGHGAAEPLQGAEDHELEAGQNAPGPGGAGGGHVHIHLLKYLRDVSRHPIEEIRHDQETGARCEADQDAVERRAHGETIENPFQPRAPRPDLRTAEQQSDGETDENRQRFHELFGEPGVEEFAQEHQRERRPLRVQSRPNQLEQLVGCVPDRRAQNEPREERRHERRNQVDRQRLRGAGIDVHHPEQHEDDARSDPEQREAENGEHNARNENAAFPEVDFARAEREYLGERRAAAVAPRRNVLVALHVAYSRPIWPLHLADRMPPRLPFGSAIIPGPEARVIADAQRNRP